MRPLPSLFLGLSLSSALLVGCGGDEIGPTQPVTGKVTLNGKPLATGSVTFWPDEAKGSAAKLEATGQIGADGSYTLTTRGKPGAPPGWHKVTVTAQAAPDPKNPYAPPKHLINPRYAQKETTDLQVEVVSGPPPPGAYDLKVTK